MLFDKSAAFTQSATSQVVEGGVRGGVLEGACSSGDLFVNTVRDLSCYYVVCKVVYLRKVSLIEVQCDAGGAWGSNTHYTLHCYVVYAECLR